MASAKIEKGSEEWQVFMDYWQFIQKYYSPDNADSWWDEVVKSGESLINKYKGMEIEERARQLVLSHFAWWKSHTERRNQRNEQCVETE